MGLFSSNPAKKTAPVKVEKCRGCRKSKLACECWKKNSTKEKATGKGTGNLVKNGNTWCGKCSCRVVNGTCQNTRCSTR